MRLLTDYLIHFRRRLRLRDGWLLAQRSLPIAVLLAFLIQGGGRFIPIPRLDVWSLAPLFLWLLAVAIYTILRPESLMHTARRVDQELNLRERLSTALAFEDQALNRQEALSSGASAAEPTGNFATLVLRQRQDALESADQVQPSHDFPLYWLPRPLAIAGLLAVLGITLAVLPNRMDAVLAEREAVRRGAAQQAERVETMAEQIEEAKLLSPEEREELIRQLEELAQKLRENPGDLEKAMADISRLEQELQARMDPNALAQAAFLEALAAQLEAMTGTERDPNQSAAEAAAKALAEIAEQQASMSPEERQQAAAQLAQAAAQASQAGDASLAQALAQMSQAMQQGDAQATDQAAGQASQAAQAAESRLTDQQALQRALQQLQGGRQALAQASQSAQAQSGQNGQTAQNPGQGPTQNQGQNPGSNPGGSQGQNPGQNQGVGPGGGSQANTLPPFQGGQANVNPQGSAPGASPTELQNQVYAPWQQMGVGTDQVFIPGQDIGQGETQTTQGQSNLPGANNQALVPYQQVFSNYYNAANQAMQQSYIPPALMQYIKDYFSQLAP